MLSLRIALDHQLLIHNLRRSVMVPLLRISLTMADLVGRRDESILSLLLALIYDVVPMPIDVRLLCYFVTSVIHTLIVVSLAVKTVLV